MSKESIDKIYQEVEPIWEPLEGEDPEWYKRFLIFCHQNGKRSMLAVYRQCGFGKQEDGRPQAIQTSPTWKKKTKEYRWVERALAYDRHLLIQRKKEHLHESDLVVDELFEQAYAAVKVLSSYLDPDVLINTKEAHVRIKAAEAILDRVGFTRRAERALYRAQEEASGGATSGIQIVLTPEAMREAAKYDNRDD